MQGIAIIGIAWVAIRRGGTAFMLLMLAALGLAVGAECVDAAVARGAEPADTVVCGGKVLSVFTREWLDCDVAIVDGMIAAPPPMAARTGAPKRATADTALATGPCVNARPKLKMPAERLGPKLFC